MEKLEWGLCYNKEKNSNPNYCDERYKKSYPCAPGVAYYGRVLYLSIGIYLFNSD